MGLLDSVCMYNYLRGCYNYKRIDLFKNLEGDHLV